MTELKLQTHNKKGKLIIFCGLDGSGKSAMIKKLSDYYIKLGKSVFLTKQPTDFVRKTEIFRNFMDEQNNEAFEYRALSLLAMSDRIQHSSKVISPALEKHDIVISDRYVYSCVANLRARGYVNDNWIFEAAKSIIKPDYSFFLDVPVELAVMRVRARLNEAERYIDIAFQEKLRAEYMTMANAYGCLISSDGIEDETFEKIINILEG